MDCLVNSSSFLDNVLWVAPVNKQDGRRGPETQKLPKRYCFWGKISQLSTFNTRWTGEINTSSIYFVYTYLLFSTSFGFGFGFAKTLRFRFRFHRNPKNGFCWPLLLSTSNVNTARFARNVEWDFFCDFQTPWKWTKLDQKRPTDKLDFKLIGGIIIQTIIIIQFNTWTERWVLPQCAISWCVDVKIVRKRVIKTVHFDNGRKRAKNRKLVTSVRDLLLRKKREKAALWVWSEKLCGNSGGNYCSLEDMNLTNIKTMFPETCKKLLQVEFYYFYYYTVMQN